jgi:hypothetical protein
MLASAWLAAAMLCGEPRIARAEDEPPAPVAAASEQRADASRHRPVSSSDEVRAAPTAAGAKPATPAATATPSEPAARADKATKPTKPFIPSDRIDAESVVPFPADI